MLKPLAHKQERALVTRRQLVQAAREVFVRDGFESARIEDIAARAGKTRGAFYDNFGGKEDIFFAIFEEDIGRSQEKMIDELSGTVTVADRITVLTRYLDELLHDKQRVLLNLEFKLYVIRHPRKRKRLSALYSEMSLRCSMTKINTLFPELIGATIEKRRRLTTEVGAVIDGLALNSLFNPEGLSRDQRSRYLQITAHEALEAVRESAG
jgi:AcrR family transcriptional regulator